MKQAIGATQIINYVIVFIVITFGFLIATLSYMKAFKVNSAISNSIEKFEGYNEFSETEITKKLSTIGYRTGDFSCGENSENIPGFHACVEQIGNANTGSYIRYKITTFIEFGPILGQHFEIPIKSQTEKIYVFSN